jgi:rRNA-processing protein FCF1
MSRRQGRAPTGSSDGDDDPRRIELVELEHRIEQTEATAKTLLREALVTNADIDRAWQMLQSQGDPRAATQQQRWLLKNHIGAITEVVHQLTNELDQVEITAQQGTQELGAGLAEMKRMQQHAIGALTATQRAGHAGLAAELRGLRVELAQSHQNQARLQQVVDGQAAQMQQMGETIMATIHTLSQKQNDDAALARGATQQLQTDTNDTVATLKKGVDHVYNALNETNDVVASNQAALEERLQRLGVDVLAQTRTEASERVAQIKDELSHISAQAAHDRGTATERATADREATESLIHAKVSEATQLLQSAIQQLSSEVRSVDATCKQRLDRISNATGHDFIATKDELRGVEHNVEARWAATESRLLGDMAVMDGKTSNAEAQVDMLSALFRTKIAEMEGRIEKNSFVVLT